MNRKLSLPQPLALLVCWEMLLRSDGSVQEVCNQPSIFVYNAERGSNSKGQPRTLQHPHNCHDDEVQVFEHVNSETTSTHTHTQGRAFGS